MIDLLSFPRSGSNWVAYILENAFGIGVIGNDPTFDVKTKTIWDNPHVLKSHGMEYTPDRQSEGLIFVLRDYKANIPKYCQSNDFDVVRNNISFIEPKEKLRATPDYLCLLRYYHNFSMKKLLINYEELTLNPEREIVRIGVFLSQFFSADEGMRRKFVENISSHAASSIGMYKRRDHPAYSESGLRITIDSNLKKRMEQEVKTRCGVVNKELYEEYLIRYEEA